MLLIAGDATMLFCFGSIAAHRMIVAINLTFGILTVAVGRAGRY